MLQIHPKNKSTIIKKNKKAIHSLAGFILLQIIWPDYLKATFIRQNYKKKKKKIMLSL